MSEKILVPTLGESVTEATVSKWLKSQGEKVSADEPIVELETDKVNVEVPAPSNGVLESISVKEGETVNVGALLGMINGASTKDSSESKEVKKYSPPKIIQITPGTAKVNLQSPNNKSIPVIRGATAIPIFPQTPLMPILNPTAPGLCNSMAIPTG